MFPWPWLPFGKRGELAAARHLRRRGFQILRHSYRCPIGEIDLVAIDGEHLVFVEVRTRATATKGAPSETVHAGKRRKLTSLAAYFLKNHPAEARRPSRFDVVSVVWPGRWWTRPEIQHLRDAFRAEGPWNP